MKVITLFQCPVRRASHNMATLSDTIKPNKTYLEAVLRTALLGKTEDEYVDFFLSGLRGGITEKSPPVPQLWPILAGN